MKFVYIIPKFKCNLLILATDPDSPAQHATSLMRSRSAQSLHDVASRDDHMTVLAQMVWVGISLLESDFEFEFLLAVRLLDKVSTVR